MTGATAGYDGYETGGTTVGPYGPRAVVAKGAATAGAAKAVVRGTTPGTPPTKSRSTTCPKAFTLSISPNPPTTALGANGLTTVGATVVAPTTPGTPPTKSRSTTCPNAFTLSISPTPPRTVAPSGLYTVGTVAGIMVIGVCGGLLAKMYL